MLEHLNRLVGQCKAEGGSFLHAGVQHEHSPGGVLTHWYVYIDSITPIDGGLFTGKGGEEQCCVVLHEVY